MKDKLIYISVFTGKMDVWSQAWVVASCFHPDYHFTATNPGTHGYLHLYPVFFSDLKKINPRENINLTSSLGRSCDKPCIWAYCAATWAN